MEALILAAGYGTRLKPLTDNKPKALVEISGKPMIYYVIKKLEKYGFNKILINTHYHAECLEEYFASNAKEFSSKIALIYEPEILDTGGAIKNIENRIEGDDFLVYNTDIMSSINLDDFVSFHQQNKNLVSLVVNKRVSRSYFLLAENEQILGLETKNKTWDYKPEIVKKSYAFCGIHLINKQILKNLNTGKFSIITSYLEMMKDGNYPKAYILDENIYWLDIGKMDTLARAKREILKWADF